jgi:N-acetylmuramoyl-L-alanine amidase
VTSSAGRRSTRLSRLDELGAPAVEEPAEAPAHRRSGRRGHRGRTVAILLAIVALLGAGAVAAGPRVEHALSAAPHSAAAAAATPLDTPAFAPGACVAYTPTKGDTHKTVFLDAGHGGIDPGGVGTTSTGQTVEESQVNLAIELEAMALLRAHGYRVVVSRTGDSTVTRLSAVDTDGSLLSLEGSHNDVVARVACANLARADALVGIYMDAAASSSQAGSVSLYDAARPFATQSQELAQSLQTEVLSALDAQGWQIPDDGVQPDSGFGSSVGSPSGGGLAAEAAAYDHLLLLGPAMGGYLAFPSAMPGAVIEPLFLTDPFEGSIAASAAGQHVIAGAIATAVERYLAPATTAG